MNRKKGQWPWENHFFNSSPRRANSCSIMLMNMSLSRASAMPRCYKVKKESVQCLWHGKTQTSEWLRPSACVPACVCSCVCCCVHVCVWVCVCVVCQLHYLLVLQSVVTWALLHLFIKAHSTFEPGLKSDAWAAPVSMRTNALKFQKYWWPCTKIKKWNN